MSLVPSPIEVLVVDDSPFMRMTIQKILNEDPGIRVVDTARDGREGIEKLQTLQPHVVTMDVEMPVMDGLQALDEIMRWQPTPVIILSAVTTEGAKATLKAFDLGAFDVVAKPSGGPGADLQTLSRDLVEKVKATAGVNLARLKRKSNSGSPIPTAPVNKPISSSVTEPVPKPVQRGALGWLSGRGKSAVASVGNLSLPKHPVEIVAIGTSTGGPSALQAVLPQLPADFPVPVLVAQHMPPGFTAPLAQRLNGLCPLTVREGVNGEVLKVGNIYIAPAGKQLQVVRKYGQLTLQIGDESPIPTLYHPSVDVMFLSLAHEIGKGALGVVMTGMGNDGAKGTKEIKAKDGFAIAESEETCVVYGMPRALVEGGLADRVTPLGEIGRAIVECVMRR
ncbi:MAG: protein-glutamate methylesterase/protein-glutamine glutaminase [Desulfitobacteriaceae bacterium]